MTEHEIQKYIWEKREEWESLRNSDKINHRTNCYLADKKK